MIKRPNTNKQRLKRHKRVRAKISGTPEMPRLNVFRSEANIYAQIIDDVNGVTLVSASSLEKDFSCDGTKSDAARLVARIDPIRPQVEAQTFLYADEAGQVQLRHAVLQRRTRCRRQQDWRQLEGRDRSGQPWHQPGLHLGNPHGLYELRLALHAVQ